MSQDATQDGVHLTRQGDIKYYGSSSVTGGTALFGDNHGTINVHQDESSVRRRQILESWTFPEMNARLNEIKESHSKTFKWAFDDTLPDKSPNGLLEWFENGNGCYLIQGKAGSGKSTFMKFLFEHELTCPLSQHWSPNRPVAKIFHSFWALGQGLQHNMKGFLASLLFQLVSKSPGLLQSNDCQFEFKRVLSDWSVKELERLLLQLCSKSISLFIVLDALDEFDCNDDIENLYLLLERVQLSSQKCKICISTRPINHILTHFDEVPSLRIQDLTKNDIYLYTKTTIQSKIKRQVDDEFAKQLDRFVLTICDKAEGVFLWVYYVLKNVCKGLRIGDEFSALKKRIQKLPSAMEDLYGEMWRVQNDDNEVHRDEAAAIFSFNNHFPMPAFRLAMAIDPSRRSAYLSKLQPLDSEQFQDFGKRFQEHLTCRSAGLIECTLNDDPRFHHSIRGFDMTQDRDSWAWMSVKYVHQTVEDFLAGTTEGTAIIKNMNKLPKNVINRALVESYLACLVQNVVALSRQSMYDVVRYITQSDTVDENLINEVERICACVIRQKLGHHNVASSFNFTGLPRLRNESFMNFSTSYTDLAGLLLCFARFDSFVTQFLDVYGTRWTPYYKGYLVSLIAAYTWSFYSPQSYKISGRYHTINQLLEAGVDLTSKRMRYDQLFNNYWTRSPAVELLVRLFWDVYYKIHELDESAIACLQRISHADLVNETVTIEIRHDGAYLTDYHRREEWRSRSLVVFSASDLKLMLQQALSHGPVTLPDYGNKRLSVLCLTMAKNVYVVKVEHRSKSLVWYEACTGKDAIRLKKLIFFGQEPRKAPWIQSNGQLTYSSPANVRWWFLMEEVVSKLRPMNHTDFPKIDFVISAAEDAIKPRKNQLNDKGREQERTRKEGEDVQYEEVKDDNDDYYDDESDFASKKARMPLWWQSRVLREYFAKLEREKMIATSKRKLLLVEERPDKRRR